MSSLFVHTSPLSLETKTLQIDTLSTWPTPENSRQFSLEIPIDKVDFIIESLRSMKKIIQDEA